MKGEEGSRFNEINVSKFLFVGIKSIVLGFLSVKS